MAYACCQICNKNFYVKPNHLAKGWGKFCSKNCQSKNQMKGKSVTCFTCNKEIYKSPKELKGSKSGNYFCSRSCQTQWRNKVFSEERSTHWVNGKSVYRNILLRTAETPKCLICNLSDSRVLNVHHKDHNRSNNAVSNLVWLCMNCHYLVHRSSELDQKMRK